MRRTDLARESQVFCRQVNPYANGLTHWLMAWIDVWVAPPSPQARFQRNLASTVSDPIYKCTFKLQASQPVLVSARAPQIISSLHA